MKIEKNDKKTSSQNFKETSIATSLPKEEKVISKNISKKYRVQIGAFSKLSNAKRFLADMENINLKLEKFIIEEDYTNGLYKILSVKNFKMNTGKNICQTLKDEDINCILSTM